MTSGGSQLRNRNVSTFSPAHASTGGNELLLRATSKRESSMREQLFAKVNHYALFFEDTKAEIYYFFMIQSTDSGDKPGSEQNK